MESRRGQQPTRGHGLGSSQMKRRADCAPIGLRALLQQVASYGVIGLASAGLDVVLFWLMVNHTQVPPQLANVASVSTGIVLSFSLNRVFTFNRRDYTLQRLLVFVVVGLIGMGVSAAILAAGLHFGMAAIGAKGISVFVVAAVQFVLNRGVTFSDRIGAGSPIV
jgi:putative flippase GtrA